jgi:CcmD family protein
MILRALLVFACVVAVPLIPEAASGQSALPDPQALASQSLRGYTHMFIAYGLTWALIFGWVFSIARRLGRLEKALED